MLKLRRHNTTNISAAGYIAACSILIVEAKPFALVENIFFSSSLLLTCSINTFKNVIVGRYCCSRKNMKLFLDCSKKLRRISRTRFASYKKRARDLLTCAAGTFIKIRIDSFMISSRHNTHRLLIYKYHKI